MTDFAFTNGVSLFEEPKSGMRGDFYEPVVSGLVDEIEMLASTYYLNFGPESQKKFLYYSKLTYPQRRTYAEEKMKEIGGRQVFEPIRRLTAGYTEAEYEQYLWSDAIGGYADMDMNRDKWYYAKNLKYTGFKSIAVDLMKVSEETGYEYDELCRLYTEQVRDGESLEDAMEYVAGVSYEHDW